MPDRRTGGNSIFFIHHVWFVVNLEIDLWFLVVAMRRVRDHASPSRQVLFFGGLLIMFTLNDLPVPRSSDFVRVFSLTRSLVVDRT